MEIGQRTTADMPFPMDGSSFATDQFLQSLVQYDAEFYKLYDRNLQYFSALHNIKGNKDIERIWPAFMRLSYEYGKVAIGRYNGKFIVLNVVEERYTIDYKVKWVKGIIAPRGYGLLSKMTPIKLKAEDVVIMRSNYNAFPFMFYWKDIIKNIMTLRSAAITASITSIKKFKRNLANNSSTIAEIENKSMLDPSTPTVDVVASPMSYFDEDLHRTEGNMRSSDVSNSTTPNSITFESAIDDASSQYDNLKNYMEFEFYMNGRRVNTNKKNERNIAKEIDTETVNFDILENDMERYLNIAVQEMNEKWGLSLEVINMAQVYTETEEVEHEPRSED